MIGAARLAVRNLAALVGRFREQHIPFLFWFFRDTLLRHKWAVLKNFIVNTIGIVCQLASLFIFYKFAKALEKDADINLLFWTFRARSSSPLFLLAAALLGFILMVVYAVCLYIFTSRNVRFRREHEEFCYKRMSVLVSRLPHPRAPVASEMLATDAIRPINIREARYSARLFSIVLDVLWPVGELICYGIVALCVNPVFSLLVMVLGFLAAMSLHGINSKAAGQSKKSEKYLRRATAERRTFLERIVFSSHSIGYDDSALNRMFDSGMTEKAAGVYYGYFLARQKSRFVINLLRAMSIIVMVLFAGASIFSGTSTWSMLAAYLVALKCLLGSASKVGSKVTMASRYYPQSQHYYEFVRDAQAAFDDTSPAESVAALNIDVPCLQDSSKLSTTLYPGLMTYLLYRYQASRRLIYELLQHVTLATNAGPHPIWLAGATLTPGSSLVESCQLPAGYDQQALWEDLSLLLPDAGNLPRLAPEEALTAGLLESIPSRMLCALDIIEAIHSRRSIVIVRPRHLSLVLGEDGAVVPALSDRIVFAAVKDLQCAGPECHSRIALVADEHEFTGWATVEWLKDHPEAVRWRGDADQDEGMYESVVEFEDEDE